MEILDDRAPRAEACAKGFCFAPSLLGSLFRLYLPHEQNRATPSNAVHSATVLELRGAILPVSRE
jgi:hypothetical protein